MSTLGIIVLIVAIAWALIVLLQPGPKYHLAAAPDGAVNSPEFARQLEAMTDTKLQSASAVEVLDNGENFYEAELAAIREAKRNINLALHLTGFRVVRTRLSLIASDHLPLVADFRVSA